MGERRQNGNRTGVRKEREKAAGEDCARPLRVGMISLGCAKNLVDAEIMLGALAAEGMEITAEAAEADAVIVNTCSFIDAAQEESVDAILEQAAVREAQVRGQAIVVAGCLPQRYRDELQGLLPEVDAFMGVDEVRQAPSIVRAALERRQRQRAAATQSGRKAPAGSRRKKAREAPVVRVTRRPTYIPDFATPRFQLTPRHHAFLKIAEGCNHPCSFCTIPRMRGGHRSRPLEDVVEEARRMLDRGVRELNLISQDTTYYGLDRRADRTGGIAAPDRFAEVTARLPVEAPTLGRLLQRLDALPGDFWIRVLYTHPAHWTDDLIRVMAESSHVARYVDVPMQHIDEVMLQRMRRETTRAHLEELVERLREGIPGVGLRTTFIVGFPGETREQFSALVDFIRATRFERLGVFCYSQESGTVAAAMRGQVAGPERRRRREVALAAQREVSRAWGAGWVGRKLRVLVEGPVLEEEVAKAVPGVDLSGRGPWWSARSEADAPGVDGRVWVRGRLGAGEFARARIVAHGDYDRVGEAFAADEG